MTRTAARQAAGSPARRFPQPLGCSPDERRMWCTASRRGTEPVGLVLSQQRAKPRQKVVAGLFVAGSYSVQLRLGNIKNLVRPGPDVDSEYPIFGRSALVILPTVLRVWLLI